MIIFLTVRNSSLVDEAIKEKGPYTKSDFTRAEPPNTENSVRDIYSAGTVEPVRHTVPKKKEFTSL